MRNKKKIITFLVFIHTLWLYFWKVTDQLELRKTKVHSQFFNIFNFVFILLIENTS